MITLKMRSSNSKNGVFLEMIRAGLSIDCFDFVGKRWSRRKGKEQMNSKKHKDW
jgi:hypothetical protein